MRDNTVTKPDLELLLAEQRRRGAEGRLLGAVPACWRRQRRVLRTALWLTAVAVVGAAALNVGLFVRRTAAPAVYCDGSRAVALADADRMMATIRGEVI